MAGCSIACSAERSGGVSEIGYGMWGMAGWTGSDDDESSAVAGPRRRSWAAISSTPPGPTATARARQLLGELLRAHRTSGCTSRRRFRRRTASGRRAPQFALDEVFPADYMREYTEISLKNLGVETIDLQQLHVWTDEWADDDRWQKAVASLKGEGLIRAFGISINRWQPANVLKALETDLIDSVQVVYNVFDQSPEDELFPSASDATSPSSRACRSTKAA